MLKILRYYSQYQGLRSDLGVLPGWAKAVLFVVALPGLVLVALSIVALLVSILALLLLTVPLKRLLVAATGGGTSADVGLVIAEQRQTPSPSGRRHIDVTIIE